MVGGYAGTETCRARMGKLPLAVAKVGTRVLGEVG